MIETVLLAFLFSKTKISFSLGRINMYKESYLIKPILKRWSVYPVLLITLFYIYLETTIMHKNYFFVPYQHIIKTIMLFSYILLGYDVLFRKERYKEIIIAAGSLISGYALNLIVMYFNNNKMPIFPSVSFSTGYTQYEMITNATKYGDFHILGDHTTRLIFLADIFDWGTTIWSIGDVLIRVFAFIILYTSIKALNFNKI